MSKSPAVERSVEDRFWSHVAIGSEDACWEWKAARGRQGYGAFGMGGTMRIAHRVAFEFTHGRVLRRDELACHHCDNPPCCNPKHLFVGTKLDNARDAIAKGRRSVSVIPKDVLREALALPNGVRRPSPLRALARAHGINHVTLQVAVWQVRNRHRHA